MLVSEFEDSLSWAVELQLNNSVRANNNIMLMIFFMAKLFEICELKTFEYRQVYSLRTQQLADQIHLRFFDMPG